MFRKGSSVSVTALHERHLIYVLKIPSKISSIHDFYLISFVLELKFLSFESVFTSIIFYIKKLLFFLSISFNSFNNQIQNS